MVYQYRTTFLYLIKGKEIVRKVAVSEILFGVETRLALTSPKGDF